MAPQRFNRKDVAPRFVEENTPMLEETYEGTVLHLATQLGHEVHAKKLIELSPSLVSSTNSKGDTPLHFAASFGHTSILIQMLEFTKLTTETLDDPKLVEMMNNDGLTPLHCAVMNGSVEILREFLDKAPSCFNSVTLETKETVFHIAARHKKNEAFIFMAKNANLGQLLYQLDAEDNSVLHVAASVGSIALVTYIIEKTKIKVTTKNKNGFAAVDLLNKDDENFLLLSTDLMCERPLTRREMGKSETQILDELKKLQKQMLRVQSGEIPKKEIEMQLEALQNARNTLTIVAVLIASVTFTCSMSPPGGVYQEGPDKGTSIAGTTVAFTIFSISNSIALFTSMCMVILLLSIIPYREESLLKFLRITHWMMWVAVAAMASAYVAAAWVTLPHFRKTRWLLYTTLAIASLTLGGMFVYLRFKLAKCMLRRLEFLKCMSSSRPVRNYGSVDMAANISKGYYSY